MARRRRRAGQRYQLGFLLAIKYGWHRWCLSLFAYDDGFNPLVHILFPDTPTQLFAAAHSFSYLRIVPLRAPRARVRVQQDPRPRLQPGSAFPFANDTFKTPALRDAQFDNILLMTHLRLRCSLDNDIKRITYYLPLS